MTIEEEQTKIQALETIKVQILHQQRQIDIHQLNFLQTKK